MCHPLRLPHATSWTTPTPDTVTDSDDRECYVRLSAIE
jgi:hypothetical protein